MVRAAGRARARRSFDHSRQARLPDLKRAIRVEDRPALYPRAVGLRHRSVPFRRSGEADARQEDPSQPRVSPPCSAARARTSPPPGTHPQMGTLTNMSAASSANWERCPHSVPKEKLHALQSVAGCRCSRRPAIGARCTACPNRSCFKCPPGPELRSAAAAAARRRPCRAFEARRGRAVAGDPRRQRQGPLFDFYAIWCGALPEAGRARVFRCSDSAVISPFAS
jgi:hypothetical protein